ncbi:MAG: hypothetical protein QF847_00625 [Candidatus Marinimicrobia bacterium]|nr:hypothetical protein [Candidatus Neomarinimicrobiota bacterium]MDP6725737.1 hypothetical protein [Candidatus Neomarinimicrobiota bacterium]
MRLILIIYLFMFAAMPVAGQDITSDTLQTASVKDPWLAYDKVLHFGISCSLVLSTQYVLENKLHVDRETALPAGVAVSAANGIIKEYWDKHTGNIFSRRDLIADAAGILVGVLIIIL